MAKCFTSEFESKLSQRISLNDKQSVLDLPGRHIIASGSRFRFVSQVQYSSVLEKHFIYDSLGMARAHNMLLPLARPFLAYIHGIEVWGNVLRNRVRGARRASLLLSNSEYTRRRAVESNESFAKSRVCWLATETDDALERVSYSNIDPNVLIVSRIDADGYKGHRELVECWPQVIKRIPEARLRIVGTGPGEPALRFAVQQSSARQNIDILGYVGDGELEELWNSSAVFCMPSRGEGFGIVYAEAMRRGIPIIGSIHDAAQEINPHGITGFNVDLGIDSQLPSRIIELVNNSQLCQELGRNGLARWKRCFCFSAFRERFIPFVMELTGL